MCRSVDVASGLGLGLALGLRLGTGLGLVIGLGEGLTTELQLNYSVTRCYIRTSAHPLFTHGPKGVNKIPTLQSRY